MSLNISTFFSLFVHLQVATYLSAAASGCGVTTLETRRNGTQMYEASPISKTNQM